MGDEHSERMDKIEKKQEEIMGQLSKILELMSTDKGKRVAGIFGAPEDVQQTEANTDPVYPPRFTPPPARNASIPMASIGQYPFFGISLYIFQFPLPSKIPNNECEDDSDSGFEVNFEKDMPRLNIDIVAHKLPLKPECKPIKQKLRRIKPEMFLKIKEEVKKQFDAGFLEVAKYPEWVANIVPMPKKNGKNAGATYQQAMVTFFHDMMHREVEVYVDDMIVKARKIEDHTTNLKRLFKRLREFQLRLNPAKCIFGVTSKKLLGFVINKRGTEVDPDKLLRKHNLGAWNEECQVTFDNVKEYLLSLLVLVPPVAERPLLLYLTVNEGSMGCVLGQHDETGKVARWQMLLSEYDIVYVSQKAIKGSAITDFLAKRVEKDYEPMEFEFSDEDLMSICQTSEEKSEKKEN
ncbi:Uncharacterized protein TCM_025829 [Theobroma cacao]|uniref:Reverse transcriptase domain-containing protein n=1 Tax=Theobroma cacao TaxID=3641 RepID=A0A061F0M7_THECC|nr:Uncharacterized protein TCM_025829 [Theobroma cacao]